MVKKLKKSIKSTNCKTLEEGENSLDLEQYKILIEAYNEEVSRFYSRQNIYTTFQLIVFSGGLIGGFETILTHPFFFRFGILLMITISLFSLLFSKRGFDIQNILIKTIAKFEKENPKLKILRYIDLVAKGLGQGVIKKMNFQSLAALVLSILMFLFWLLFWIFVDIIYNII